MYYINVLEIDANKQLDHCLHYSPESWQVVNMEYLHFWGWDMQGMVVCRYVLSIEY